MKKFFLNMWKIIIDIFFIFFVVLALVLGFKFFMDFQSMRATIINCEINASESKMIEQEFKINLNRKEKILSTEMYFGSKYSINIVNVENVEDFINNSLNLNADDFQEPISRMNYLYKNMRKSEKNNINKCKDIGFSLRKEDDNSLYSEDILIYIYNDEIFAQIEKERIYNDSVISIFKQGKKQYDLF